MVKSTIATLALVLSGLFAGSSAARADDFNCVVNAIAERPGVHTVAITCANSPRGAVSPGDPNTIAGMAQIDRFLSVVTAGMLSGRTLYVDVGACTLDTDCVAKGWLLR